MKKLKKTISSLIACGLYGALIYGVLYHTNNPYVLNTIRAVEWLYWFGVAMILLICVGVYSTKDTVKKALDRLNDNGLYFDGKTKGNIGNELKEMLDKLDKSSSNLKDMFKKNIFNHITRALRIVLALTVQVVTNNISFLLAAVLLYVAWVLLESYCEDLSKVKDEIEAALKAHEKAEA